MDEKAEDQAEDQELVAEDEDVVEEVTEESEASEEGVSVSPSRSEGDLERMPRVGEMVGYYLPTLPARTTAARVTACHDDGSLDLEVVLPTGARKRLTKVGPARWVRSSEGEVR